MRAFSLLFLLAVLVAACGPVTPDLSADTVSTPAPLSKPEDLTLSPLPAATATAGKTSAPPSIPFQTEPAPTPANPQIDGIAEIAILRPGQLSRLSSPFRVLASLSHPADERVLITLYGEDGRTLAEEVYNILPYLDPVNGNVITEIAFEIEALAETGRLEFKVYDQFKRLRAVNSVYLILLSRGGSDRNYDPEDGERIALQIPFPNQTEISGSPLFLSGLVRLTIEPETPQPLNIQLVDKEGVVVGEGTASIVPIAGTRYGQFVGEIAYQVEEPVEVLLTISIREGRLPGIVYLRSFALTLLP